MNTLSNILYPFNISLFHSDFYTKSCLHLPGCADKFSDLFTWDSLNNLLNYAPVPHPTIKLVRLKTPIYAKDHIAIIEECRRGATLIIEQTHHYDPKIYDLASGLAKDLCEPVQVNLYYSQKDIKGYDLHYDTHDVFILQVYGKKLWKIYEPTIDFPLFNQKYHGKTPPKKLLFNIVLNSGDALYLPRGFWHEAIAVEESSLHLTVGILARTGINFLSWLVDELREDPLWRTAFPSALTNDEERVGDPSTKVILQHQKLKEYLIGKLQNPHLLADYQTFCIAQQTKRRPFNFPFDLTPSVISNSKYVKFGRNRNQQVSIKKNVNTGKVELVVWGKLLHFSEAAFPLLKHIFSSERCCLKDIYITFSDFSEDSINVIFNTLVYEGLIIPLKSGT